MTSPCMAATSCSKASRRSSVDVLSKPLHQQPNVHDSPRVRSNSLRYHVDVYQCDDTIFSSRFEQEDCMRTFSQSEPTRLLSSLQGKSQSATSSQMPQDPGSIPPVSTSTNRQSRAMSHVAQYRPTKHITHDETQRVATKPDFHQQKKK